MGETPVEWRRNSIAHPSDSRVLSRVTHLLKLCQDLRRDTIYIEGK
jgi:hypothetical protein